MQNPGDLSLPQLVKDLKTLRRMVNELEGVNNALRRSVDSLLHKESRCAIAMAAARAGICEFNLEEGTAFLDLSLGLMLGLQPEENSFTFDQLIEFVPEDEREKLRTELQRIESGQTDRIQVEFHVNKGSSDILCLAFDGSLALNDSGQPERLVGICRDVTAFRKSTESGSENPDA